MKIEEERDWREGCREQETKSDRDVGFETCKACKEKLIESDLLESVGRVNWSDITNIKREKLVSLEFQNQCVYRY